ncbi:MAG: hypothetical protein ACMG6S_10320, partial [Byssovorax sp.]
MRAVLARHAPPAHVDWVTDSGARREYLDALWGFVEPLPPSFNALKAQILQHRLELDRRLGTFDRARLLRYLELPRAVSYVEPTWLRRFSADQIVRPGPSAVVGLDPAFDDEALVREYLRHFLAQEGVDAFADHLRRDWLDVELATARLLAGDPDTRRWTSMLGEGALTALRERVEIELSPRNPRRFAAGDPVTLEVVVKNVPELQIKVFRINALAYFLARGAEVDTSLDLDGMVAGDERTVRVEAPPLQRTRMEIELPGCARPGTYVVELLGNGKSSRALIRKGALRHTTRIGAAGPTLSVFDEAGRFLPDARVWMGGREYEPREDGEISIPFSTSPTQAPMLLVHGDLAQREVLSHPAERFVLAAGIHLERQALVAGKSARILLRPLLSVAASPAPIALLEEPRVEITVTDLGGVSTTRVEPVALRDDAEAVVEIRVPEDTVHLGVRLRGQVRVASTQQLLDLEDGAEAEINLVHRSAQTEVMHLATTEAGHVLHLLGKSGEPRPGRAIALSFKHAAVTFEVAITLSTDERGRIELGPLPGVERVRAGQEAWDLWPDTSTPSIVGAEADAAITLPAVPFLAADALPLAVSLSELRGAVALRDCTDRVRLDQRALVIAGLEPGRYQLACRGLRAPIQIEVAERAVDAAAGGRIAGPLLVELSPPLPLIRSLAVVGEELVARVSDAGPDTRVHVIATLFRPSAALPRTLAWTPPAGLTRVVPAVLSHYVSGRDIGEEPRYILERRSAARRPGVLLEKPSLLLNPWARRSTSSERQVALAGGDYAASQARVAAPAPTAALRKGARVDSQSTLASFDFLATPAVVIANLRPDADGIVRVPRGELGAAQLVRLV